jgi:hypothetical protein
LQKHPTVTIPSPERPRLGRVTIDHLRKKGIELLALAIGGRHVHLQLKCDPGEVIATLGSVKRALWYERREAGNGERLWGKGRKIVRIRNREHQVAVLEYILSHRDEGAWVWCWRDDLS